MFPVPSDLQHGLFTVNVPRPCTRENDQESGTATRNCVR